MKRYLFAGMVVVAAVLLGSVVVWWIREGKRPAAPRGQVVYEENCAVCHGLMGDGKSEAAYLFQPKPRNFRAGKFRLVSSENLQPTREDLFQTITNGMPGTAMPSWVHLPESDRWALADYVLELNRQGWYDKAIELGDSPAEADEYAGEMTDPGEPIPIPPEPPVTPAGLRQGRRFYLTACANCHGKNGEGREDPTWRTAEGYPTWSRNLREGVIKGGRDGKQLYLTFATGLPGTPMPSQTLSPEQVWRVVQYVQSLSDPKAQEDAQIRIQTLAAKRVPSLPVGPEDALWESVPSARVPLMPLWWHEGYIPEVRIKAVHDGHRLAFRLEWDDPTRDAGAIEQQKFSDGAAVQLTANASPPLFAMGVPGEPVNIWHWKAVWSEDQKRFGDVGTAFPRMVADAYFGSKSGWHSGPLEDTRFLPAVEVQNLIASQDRPGPIEDANAAGLGTLASQSHEGQNVQGLSAWQDGVWRLQLVREITSPDPRDVPLQAGKTVSVAFAIWDGSAGDRDGQKSVSIWNTLTLE
ncbi:ethylbenzene dehydrogenase-related protein [Acidobacteriia bacterium AH_259_A11_L15]|nr:ethylbenzene dehydrogenase-related protein [Acidobacteriia bacterium AH_259_A11_L15]